MGEYLTIGTLIGGRYEILEKIGSGGMAIVYKAKCRLLNRFVAIKLLRPEFKDDEEFISKFNIESQAAASLSHPNVVSIYDVGWDGDLHYIVMEYVEGITLKEFIQKNGAIDWRTAAGYSAQICSALEHAHKNHIVHRDIKPHNIIMTPDGVLKVTDFGIARAATSSTVVVGSSAIGSVHYFSPEQARGGYTDEKSDIYSLGIVMFEMLTGRLPFDGDSPVTVALMQVQNQPPDMSDIRDDIPESIQSIVYKAISKEQRLRYQSASEMLSEINSLLSDPENFVVDNEDRNALPEDVSGSDMKKGKGVVKKKKAPMTKQEKWIALSAVGAGVIVILILANVILSFLGINLGWAQKEVEVPSVVNMDTASAKAILKNTKFQLVIEEEVESDTVEKGIILSQDPDAGRLVKGRVDIKVKVSLGPKAIKVPSVLNLDQRSAIMAIEAAGLKATVTETPSEAVPEGLVMQQVPESGATAKAGDVVRLYISGKASTSYVKVPGVVNKTEQQAKADIENAGLVVNVTRQVSDKAEGTVLTQSPEAGLSVEKKSAVTIVVAQKAAESNTNTVTPTPTPTPTSIVKPVKTLTIPVPQNKESTQIKIIANDKEIHNQVHYKSEKSFDIKVSASTGNSAVVQIYHDGVLKTTETVTFD